MTLCGVLSAAAARGRARALRAAQHLPPSVVAKQLDAEVHHDTHRLTTPDVNTGTCLFRIAESQEPAKLRCVSDGGEGPI